MKKLNLGYAATLVLLGSVLSTGILMGSDNNKRNNENVMVINDEITLAVDSVFTNLGNAASLDLLSLIRPRDNRDLRTLFTQEIKYPRLAVESNTEGTIKVLFTVGSNGNITEANVVGRADETLSDAVMAAVQKLKLQPIIQNGIPVSYKLLLSVRFDLL